MELIISPIFWGCLLPVTMAACHDLDSYLLPNYLTAYIFCASLIYGDMGVWHASPVGAGIGFVIGLIGAFLGQMGMGDAKLMAGLGAWLNPTGFIFVLFIACCFGVIWGLFILLHYGGFKNFKLVFWRRLPEDLGDAVSLGVVPFGACLGAALWLFIILVLLGGI